MINNNVNNMINNNESSQDLSEVNGNNVLLSKVIDPDIIIKNATTVANSLSTLITTQKLYTAIKGKKYVHIEGWCTLMSILRITPKIIKCTRLDRSNEIVYETVASLVSNDGNVICVAIALCSNKEPMKRTFDEYAVMSMSQTRAIGKAARLSLGWIMKLANYEGTPAEEMPQISADGEEEQKPSEQEIQSLLKEAGASMSRNSK